ncbi:unnamed protein product [Caenorhabditis angaria]|uniref:Uncharacterized protein n=1 Tax=Caenorhabditis angaria TaxID=860376 RepID=A0A9P1I4X9_9PELO|nr:unnamed protein product [Caenorhabditis angaria]
MQNLYDVPPDDTSIETPILTASNSNSGHKSQSEEVTNVPVQNCYDVPPEELPIQNASNSDQNREEVKVTQRIFIVEQYIIPPQQTIPHVNTSAPTSVPTSAPYQPNSDSWSGNFLSKFSAIEICMIILLILCVFFFLLAVLS